MKEYISNNQAETEKIATELAKELKGGELLALSGNLGAGKIEYERADKFVHVDCYRLSIQEDLFEIGLGDYLNYDNIIVAIEWADKIANLPDTAIKIHIELIKDDKRKITII